MASLIVHKQISALSAALKSVVCDEFTQQRPIVIIEPIIIINEWQNAK